ncbi:MAG TPA: DUF742 domain-containing protein [Amycolatopsis sp.]|nr:DUF742 domain-containing protein [Amycolatopsis sp.]
MTELGDRTRGLEVVNGYRAPNTGTPFPQAARITVAPSQSLEPAWPTESPDEFAGEPVARHGWVADPSPIPGPRTLVRPYVLTRGRTQGRRYLAIEALVKANADDPRWRGPDVKGEFRIVRSLCLYPRSVAEVAATLTVPLGVARVLLDDMAELGLVTIHAPGATGDGRPAMALMERVLEGLHRL